MTVFDTNVLIYACDRSDPHRQQAALDLVENASGGAVLWQAACEFVAASRQLSVQGFTASNAWTRLAEFLAVLRLVLPSGGVLQQAQTLHLSHHVSFWDAMILAACLDAGADVLYTEDVPGIPAIGGLRIVNPFQTR